MAASPLSGAVVESDDYVVIDEPWTEREAVAAGPLLPAPHDDLPSAIAAEALMAGATAATPVEVEAPELPVR
ncbi:MAG TPA: hypothetical protein PJ982_08930, partial [Lacipirellulaceae bacterium]|nr:hypothetical protein [Lacipirellulaceae bacterium]